MDKKDSMVDLNLPENSNRSLIGVYFKLIFIPVLMYIGLLAGYFRYIDFKVELHSVIMIGFLLFIALVFARHSAEYGCCLFEDRIDIFKAGLKDYIMSNLIVVGNLKKSGASFEEYADDFNRDVRNSNYATVAAGVFPMLGILGTFISIAISMPNFSSSDINLLEGEIAQLLGGVGTAFYVSIFGIFLALWWIYFEKKGLSRYQKLIFKYKAATKNFFWDDNEISRSLMRELIEKNDKVATLFEYTFNSNIDKNLNDAMNQKMKNLKDMIEFEEGSLKNSTKQLENIKDFSEKIANNADQLNKKYEETISSFDKILIDSRTIYQAISNELIDAMELNSKNYSKFEQSIDKFVRKIDMFERSFDVAKKKEDSIQENIDIAEELKKTFSNLDKSSKSILRNSENSNENQ